MGRPSHTGIWYSTKGGRTMKAEQRNEPRIDASKPMITMNRIWKERLMSKASGPHEPRRRNPHMAPATPIMKELTAKALSFATSGRMQMISAAMSVSRIAIHDRRSEGRRVGKEGVSTGDSWGSPYQ